MSRKLLFYSDVHLRESGSFPAFNQFADNGLTRELNNIILGFDFVADMIREHKPLLVALPGDVYNTTEFQSARVLQASDIAFNKVKNACDAVNAPHHIIDGNHDLLSETPRVSNIANLVGYGFIHHEVHYTTVGEFRIAFVPASDNHGTMFSRLQDAQNNADLIVTHADFSGCRYESGHPSASPLPAHWNVPIVSGDIHLPQDVGSVYYVGSLVQNKFYRNTLESVGGILLYDIDTGKVERIRNNYSKHYIKVLDEVDKDLPDPRHCILQVVSSKSKEEVAEKYKAYEHSYMPLFTPTDGLKVNYSAFSFDNPEKLLRLHVNKERPEAMDTFEDIMSRS